MKYLTISQAASLLNVSKDTLRRWDKNNKLKPNKIDKKTGYRYYSEESLVEFLKNLNLFKLALSWAKAKKGKEPQKSFYCNNTSVLNYRLNKLENDLMKVPEFKETYSLLTSMVGEIGNNSFDHNIGNWSDIPGIFFAYNIEKRQIILADRGQGVLATLSRVKKIKDHKEALEVAFTEIISGRAPEARGNGLKYVRNIITKNKNFKLKFQSGDAELLLRYKDKNLNIKTKKQKIKGCLVLISF
jgi:excisionase family DNA binding protein